MRHRTTIPLLTLILVAAIAPRAGADEIRIGYTNIEAVLALLPDTAAIEQQLQTYERQLSLDLERKQEYARVKMDEYLQHQQAGDLTADAISALEQELMQLDRDIQDSVAEAEHKLLVRRQELLEPLLERMQAAIDAVAQEGGYTYILNHTTGGGVSTLLHGPEEDDITAALLAKLGVEIP